jgi:hypothetical protein
LFIFDTHFKYQNIHSQESITHSEHFTLHFPFSINSVLEPEGLELGAGLTLGLGLGIGLGVGWVGELGFLLGWGLELGFLLGLGLPLDWG